MSLRVQDGLHNVLVFVANLASDFVANEMSGSKRSNFVFRLSFFVFRKKMLPLQYVEKECTKIYHFSPLGD